jgi:hypothetical protein
MRLRSIFVGLVAFAALGGCTSKASQHISEADGGLVLPDGPAVRVLFLGNSLTAGNGLPAVVQAVAAAGGVRLEYESCTLGDTSLEDHWQSGRSREMLSAQHWDFLVLQQGPSSRPESQVNLREWAQTWADEARRCGTKPALYMVWPFQGQAKGFELVSQSYRAAAKASGCQILAAGDAWNEALQIDPQLPLYQSDRLHPTNAGSYLAALVIAQGLTGIDPDAIPARLTLAHGPELVIPEEQANVLREAAARVKGG